MKSTSVITAILSSATVVVMVLITSCATADITKNQQSMDNSRKASISSGQCRVIAKVISVQPISTSAPKDSPCSKVPCKAVVMVEKVLGYGAGFTNPLTEGKETTLNFAFTLSSTKDLFPSLAEHLPGLSIGDTFTGNIEGTNTIGEYKIYSYTKGSKE